MWGCFSVVSVGVEVTSLWRTWAACSRKRDQQSQGQRWGKAWQVQGVEGSQCEQRLGRGENDRGEVNTGRGQGKKLGLSSEGSHRRLLSREGHALIFFSYL